MRSHWVASLIYILVFFVSIILDFRSCLIWLALVPSVILRLVLPQPQTKKTIRIADNKLRMSSWYWTDVYLLENIFNLKTKEMDEGSYGVFFNYRIPKNEVKVYRNLSKEDAERIVGWIPQSHFGEE